MGSSDAHLKARSNNDDGVIRSGDKSTVEGRTVVGGKEETLAEARHGKYSTATTVSSQSKQTGISSNIYTSHVLEEETDPTSSPSEILDEPDRKYTESPMDSDGAVYGSDSVHSESSESSADSNDLWTETNAAVNAIGDQFEELGISREAVSFYNPENDHEARYIKDKLIKAHSGPSKLTMLLLVTDRYCRHLGGHRPSPRGTLPEPRNPIPSLRPTQRVS